MHEHIRKTAGLRWYALRDAAQILAVSPAALRKQLERRARRVADGAVEASIDCVRGGPLNRFGLSAQRLSAELKPQAPGDALDPAVAAATHSSERIPVELLPERAQQSFNEPNCLEP